MVSKTVYYTRGFCIMSSFFYTLMRLITVDIGKRWILRRNSLLHY